MIITTASIIQDFLEQNSDVLKVEWEGKHGAMIVHCPHREPLPITSFPWSDDVTSIRMRLEKLQHQLNHLPIETGDTITTYLGNKCVVGSVETDQANRGDGMLVMPEGAHEYTYWIPFCNIVRVEKPKQSGVHPTSAAIWKVMDEVGVKADNMCGYLRLFIASEYDRDAAVLTRLERWLKEVTETETVAMTEEEYNKALEEVEPLLGKEDFASIQRVEFLSTQIEAYEAIHCEVRDIEYGK